MKEISGSRFWMEQASVSAGITIRSAIQNIVESCKAMATKDGLKCSQLEAGIESTNQFNYLIEFRS